MYRVGADGRLEPLCAIYSAEALPVVTNLIARGERKISLLFDPISTRFVAFDELRHLKGAELFFENINTPQDYMRALDSLRKAADKSLDVILRQLLRKPLQLLELLLILAALEPSPS